MTDHLFDDFVREKLADHSSPVPGGLWEKIEAATAEKSRKKGLARIPAAYRVAALLILCAGASALLFWPGKQNIDPQNTQPLTVNPAPPSQHTNPSASADSTAQWQQQTAEAGTTAKTGTTPEAGTTEDINTTEKINTTVTAGTNKNQESPSVNKVNTPPATANRVNENNATRQKNIDNINRQYLANKSAAEQNRFHQNKNSLIQVSPNTSLNPNKATEEYSEAAAFSMLPAEMISLKTLSAGNTGSLKQLLDSKGTMMPVIRCPVVRNRIPTDLYLEVYGSPVAPFKQTSANYGGSAYLERKDSSQQLRTSFSAGVRLSKGLTENLFLKTGLQYTQINENFNYRQENERKQITVITEHTISRPQGDTVLRDTSSYEQIGYLQKRVHNKYKNIDIPILFSYEWGNDQFRMAANAGVIVNLYSWYTGEMLDTAFQAVSVKNNSNEVYKNNIGLGLYAGFSFIKPVSEKMDLFAEPYFRYNLSNMTRPGQSFNQRLHSAGLSLGIRYRLNGGQRF